MKLGPIKVVMIYKEPVVTGTEVHFANRPDLIKIYLYSSFLRRRESLSTTFTFINAGLKPICNIGSAEMISRS